ncbi:Periplasmic substrate-binding protein of sugar ABC transporter [Azotobacter vinelandii CA]|uniref:Periplasmic substrate-binding protein of sugar ABC transporter n=2 Tax=Azotobacter vinelandii TaxID=354 RepID=C1DLB1_AZOVD|nr:sugar ABC transporter substrate-binding protein [Azotobacter vinelandii]ACO81104.1 Periplasmic substrate-binding protein of sugar ABC transporter [Azotobacter vinelandii DJ]AGK14171.1 Periplasmic substrate-binding protein of sugar ABC transporter [Azotobacter vinelandii CA]AGK22364.1 Periplasmic substrate-binding protein of sugar ABC transporter [Azotobacter vinelandii CA6]SFX93268.1 monosaccharide ABC transporter substrate-binding protein, CUT2 family [Azotobacter vinelandii]GLK61087.1 rhi
MFARTKKRLIATALALGLTGPALAGPKIGAVISTFDDNYITYVREYLAARAKAEGVEVQFEDSRNDVVKQLSQVESFISQKVDAVIVMPVDTSATRSITEAAVKAGIPLVYLNREPDDPKLPPGVATVISDELEAGRLQMQYMAEKMGGKGRIGILMGDLSQNATRSRTKGLKEVLAKYPGITVVEEQTGLWLRDKGMDLTSNWLLAGQHLDAILANNDEMGIGAAMALRQSGQKDVLVGGIDGTPDALTALKRGLLAVSVFQDARAQAEGALDAALKMAAKQPIEQRVVIPFRLITADNVGEFQMANKR